MRASSSFSKKLEISVSKQLGRELARFSQLCACAGIRRSAKQARKARGNHYGEFTTDSGKTYWVPPRQFVWAATRDRQGASYSEEIKRIIIKGIHDNPKPHTQKSGWESVETINEVTGLKTTKFKQVAANAEHGTPVFAGRNGYEGFLKKIADQMATNQYNAIETRNIVGRKHNAESTIKKKGFDQPLVDSGEMEAAIEGWVMKQ